MSFFRATHLGPRSTRFVRALFVARCSQRYLLEQLHQHGLLGLGQTSKPTLVHVLASSHSLSDLRLVAELPRSAIGKVLKRELRERYLGSS